MNYLNLLERKNHQSFVIKATEDYIQNGKDLLKKYSEISNTGLTQDQRYILYLEPGIFDLGSASLILNKSFVDIMGLNQDNKTIITSNISSQSNGTINQLVDYVNLSNLSIRNTNTSFQSPWHTLNLIQVDRAYYEARLNLLPSAYFQNFNAGQNFGQTNIENVDFLTLTESIQSMRIGVSYNGTYKNVSAGNFSFGFKSNANGKFINCIGGNFSFGSFGGEAKGYFEGCTAGYWSFGSQTALVNGNFLNCSAKENSFGIEAAANNGSYINCQIN
jgi:hypothetical protein